MRFIPLFYLQIPGTKQKLAKQTFYVPNITMITAINVGEVANCVAIIGGAGNIFICLWAIADTYPLMRPV
jgi:hypothetical protein